MKPVWTSTGEEFALIEKNLLNATSSKKRRRYEMQQKKAADVPEIIDELISSSIVHYIELNQLAHSKSNLGIENESRARTQAHANPYLAPAFRCFCHDFSSYSGLINLGDSGEGALSARQSPQTWCRLGNSHGNSRNESHRYRAPARGSAVSFRLVHS